MHRFASVILVDPRGWILMQERDDRAVIDPDRWGFPGGHVEDGEEPEAAAYRELAEETGIRLQGGLEAWRELRVFHEAYGTLDPVHLWAGGTRLTDADIRCTEGRQIVFVDPERVPALPLTAAAAQALDELLGSADHQRLRDAAASRTAGSMATDDRTTDNRTATANDGRATESERA